jgi:DNA-binding MarR family transcriptional regulator
MRDDWLSDEEQQAWRSFLSLHGELTARLNRQLQVDSKLSIADYEVLVQLSEAPAGRLRPFELATGLQWEQSRLSHHVGRMQRRGLVGREECTADGRGAFLVLTACGRATIEAAAPGHVAMVRKLFFDALTPEQVVAIHEITSQARAKLVPAGSAELCDGTGDGAAETECPPD